MALGNTLSSGGLLLGGGFNCVTAETVDHKKLGYLMIEEEKVYVFLRRLHTVLESYHATCRKYYVELATDKIRP